MLYPNEENIAVSLNILETEGVVGHRLDHLIKIRENYIRGNSF